MTVADRHGRFLAGIERAAPAMRKLFCGIAANATNTTDAQVVSALRSEVGATVWTHEPGRDRVGWARREAVRMALRFQCDRILYSDLDHVIRWIERAPEEVVGMLDVSLDCDVLIVGRSPAAFARSPARLRTTESLVNHVYELATGRRADLMFAIRVLSSRAARSIVERCREDTIASDVEWPVFAELAGFSVRFAAADGLDYRTTAGFDKAADDQDRDPAAWIERVDIAACHLNVLRRLILSGEDPAVRSG